MQFSIVDKKKVTQKLSITLLVINFSKTSNKPGSRFQTSTKSIVVEQKKPAIRSMVAHSSESTFDIGIMPDICLSVEPPNSYRDNEYIK